VVAVVVVAAVVVVVVGQVVVVGLVGEVFDVLGQPLSLLHSLLVIVASSKTTEVVVLLRQLVVVGLVGLVGLVGEVFDVLGQPLSLLHSLLVIAASSSTAEVVVLSPHEEINSAVRHTDITKTKRMTKEPFLSSSVQLNQPLTGCITH